MPRCLRDVNLAVLIAYRLMTDGNIDTDSNRRIQGPSIFRANNESCSNSEIVQVSSP